MLAFPSPLVEGILVQRYKRFLADVRLADGAVVTAHCANTGSMRTCGAPGDRVFLLHHQGGSRKLAYSWELTATKDGFVGVNTARPNPVIAAALAAGQIPELAGYSQIKPEVKYGANSRIDLLLTGPGRPDCYVEIKNTTLLAGATVQFPDAVTERGRKHLHELAAAAAAGKRAVLVFFVNRPEGSSVGPADAIDPEYGKALRAVAEQGVELLAYRAVHSLTGIRVGGKVAVEYAKLPS